LFNESGSRLNWFDKGAKIFGYTKNEYSDYGDVETPRRKNSADEFLFVSLTNFGQYGSRRPSKTMNVEGHKSIRKSIAVIDNRINSLKTHFREHENEINNHIKIRILV
jgi:hypothetical protein